DAGAVAFLDGTDRLGARWVDEAEDAEQNEPVLGIRVIDIAHVRRGLFQGNGQQPLTLGSQAVQAFMPTNNVYRLLPALRPLGLAHIQNAFRSTLGDDEALAFPAFMERRHVGVLGLERDRV